MSQSHLKLPQIIEETKSSDPIQDEKLDQSFLPTLIFGDIHIIPEGNKIISKLINSNLGYTHFLDEISHDINSDQWIKELEVNIAYIDDYKNEMKAVGLNCEKVTDVLTYINHHSAAFKPIFLI